MPSAYASRSGSSGGSAYASRSGGGTHIVARGSGKTKKKAGHHGVLGLVENLGSDVAHAVAGIPMGVVETVHHPVRTAKATAKQYKQTYGPLLHGDVAKFLHNVYEHPLGPALDLATLVTLGSGGAAKVGLLGAEARTARELELAIPGSSKTMKITTSTNPVIRARQVAIHKALNRLPHDFEHFGQTLRFGRELERLPRHEAIKARAAMRTFNRAMKGLSERERGALHVIMRGVHPDDWLEVLRKQEHPQPEMIRVLEDPKIRELVDHPSQAIEKAIPAYRELASLDAALKIKHKILTPEDALARETLHQRITEETLGRPGRGTGHAPAYVPDVLEHKLANAQFEKMGGGAGVPKTPGSMRHNEGVLFKTGRLALTPDLLGTEYLRTIKYALHDDIHSELMSSARRIGKDENLPQGWKYIRRPIKTKTGNIRAEKIHPIVGSSGERARSLEKLIPDPEDVGRSKLGRGGERSEVFGTTDTAEAATLHDHYLIVPEKLLGQMAGEFHRSNRVIRTFVGKPTQVWRSLVLGLRVGFLTNNVVGNHLLYAIHAAGLDGLRAYLNAVKREHGTSMVRSLLEDRQLPPALREKFMDEFFPEQAHGSFGETQRPATKLGRAGRTGALGVLPATQAVAETNLRRALVETYIRKSPEFKAVHKAMPKQTREFEAAAEKILRGEGGAAFQRQISEKVNNVLGDYLNLGATERNVLRAAFPFYSWYKAITRISAHLALDTPGRANLLTKIGNVGVAATEAQLGALPEWLQGVIPVGGERDGQHGVLTTGGFNPFQTLTPLGQGIGGVLTGKPGDIGKAFSELGPNPIALATLEQMAGKQFFTGRTLTGGGGLPVGIAREMLAGLPQTQLIQALRGHGAPSKTYGQRTAQQALLAFLGIPLKELNMRQAQRYANTS